MIQQARDRGLLPAAEVKFIQAAMELGQIQAREVMVPRPDVHALPASATLEDTMTMFATTQRSRIPVYEGTLDHILGFVHIKDMIWILLDRARRAEDRQPLAEFNLRIVLRDALIVPETKPVSELLLEFRARRTGLAMIVDEFGSILGLATLEDILEQMVGEIHDEFDVVERPLTLPDGGMIFDAAIKIRELAARYNIMLPEDPSYETSRRFRLNAPGIHPARRRKLRSRRLSLHRDGNGPSPRLAPEGQSARRSSRRRSDPAPPREHRRRDANAHHNEQADCGCRAKLCRRPCAKVRRAARIAQAARALNPLPTNPPQSAASGPPK